MKKEPIKDRLYTQEDMIYQNTSFFFNVDPTIYDVVLWNGGTNFIPHQNSYIDINDGDLVLIGPTNCLYKHLVLKCSNIIKSNSTFYDRMTIDQYKIECQNQTNKKNVDFVEKTDKSLFKIY